MQYVLGIDQGGTKTNAVVADTSGNILGLGSSGGGAHFVLGMAPAMALVREAAEGALRQAGITANEITLVCGGLSGADFENEYELLRTNVVETLGVPNVLIVNDCIIAMRAGLSKRAGAVICAGTGLNVAVHNADGAEFILGYYIDDRYQGAGALGKNALLAVFDAEAKLGPETMLTDKLLAHFNTPTVDALLQEHIERRIGVDERKELTYTLAECAAAGDAVSADILRTFALDCFGFFRAGMQKLGLSDCDLELVISGGVFKSRYPLMLDTLKQAVAETYPSVRLVEAAWEPVVGAALLALDALNTGAELDEGVYAAIQQACVQHGLIRQTKGGAL